MFCWSLSSGLLGVITAVLLGAAPRSAAPPRASSQPARSGSQIIHSGVDATLTKLEESGDFKAAEGELVTLLDRMLAYGATEDLASFREVTQNLRLVRQLGAVDQEQRGRLLKYLRKAPDLAAILVTLVRPEDNSKGVYATLDALHEKFGSRIEQYADLTAAICVVHDVAPPKPPKNSPPPPDASEVFAYYTDNEKRMLFGIKAAAAELLVYVVDPEASMQDMRWALARYAGDTNVGARFFDIQYDSSHLYQGTPKAIETLGRTLPNILQYGGVCAEQAWFAAQVGKAIGVPATYTQAAGADLSHAWVGFLERTATGGFTWNFNNGRYSRYQGLRGNVRDPQTRKSTPDGFVALTAAAAVSRPLDRRDAAALTDAAQRLIELQKKGETLEADPLLQGTTARRSVRQADTRSALALLESAIAKYPGHIPAWLTIRDLAADGKLTLDVKRKWVGVVDRLCGRNFPDFSFALLVPMIQDVENPRQQDALWASAFASFQSRPDLAAEIRMMQGEMWEKAAENTKALGCYTDVVARYANAGPFAVTALKKADELLTETKQSDKALKLYAQAWSLIRRPTEKAQGYKVQSNWYKVGQMYAEKLRAAGRTRDADTVTGIIESGPNRMPATTGQLRGSR